MKVNREAGVKLLVELDYPTAGEFNEKRLEMKLRNLPKIIKESGQEPASKDCKTLLAEIVAAVDKGESISIDGAAEGKTEKSDKKDKKEKKGKGKPEHGKGTPRGEGVIATILDAVKAASKSSPLSKAECLKILIKKFPDRDAEGMEKTIGIQLPSRLNSEKNANIVRVEGGDGKPSGYYVSSKPIEKVSKEEKTESKKDKKKKKDKDED